jgi:Flp pilus assembly protein TadD
VRDRARQLAAQGREDEADRLFRQAWLLESQQDTPEPDRGVIEVVKG